MADTKVVTLFNYIGGKTWLRNQLREEIQYILTKNPHIKGYVEPFAGSLGAFLNVYDTLYAHNIKTVILNDINSKLINFYNILNTQPDALLAEYMLIENAYLSTIPENAKTLHKTKDKATLKTLLEPSNQFYKETRQQFNQLQEPIVTAAQLLFLQNHCFNGVYRENSSGGYNTPYNWEFKYFNQDKLNEKILSVKKVFDLFDIQFTNQSFQSLDYNNDTLYYLDPPYLNDHIGENKYHKDGFNFATQQNLIKLISNQHFLYSNHYHEKLINEFYQFSKDLKIKQIPRKNIISASTESRKNDKLEILISKNY